jgi:ornithine cyclodeaminase/alanine dehydrogenase-like protein (mu-crystallin family)
MGESNKEECISPPRFAIPLGSGGGAIGFMPAYLKKSKKLGIKIISHILNNPKRCKLPIIQGVFLLSNSDNGKILSIINAGIITSYRTAAAAAVSKKLAISNPKKLAILGAGIQGMSVLMAMKEIFNFKEISIFDIIDEKVERFILKAKEEISVKIKITKSKDPAQAAENSDIITTVTHSKIPFLEAGMLKKGFILMLWGLNAS